MSVAKAKGRLRSKQPKLSEHQRKPLLGLVDAGEYTRGEIVERMGVSRITVYREIQRTARPTTS